MNKEHLFEAITDIDDGILLETQEFINEKNKKKRVKLISKLSVCAACLCLAVVGVTLLQPFGNLPQKPALDSGFSVMGANQNSFTIIANAAEDDTLSEDVIGIYSGESGHGSYLEGFELSDYMNNYRLTKLSFKGENIKSVKLQSNKNNCLFTNDVIAIGNDDSYSDIIEKSLPNNIKLDKKTSRELRNWNVLGSQGVEGTPVDRNAYEVKFDDMLNYMVVCDSEDKEIGKWLTQRNEKEKEYKKIAAEEHAKYGDDHAYTPTPRQEVLSKEIDRLVDKVIKKSIAGAEIRATVQFLDGTSKSAVIKVEYDGGGSVLFKYAGGVKDTTPVNLGDLNLPKGTVSKDVKNADNSMAMCVAAFNEKMLKDSVAILEGTITKAYVKEYNYRLHCDKFEKDGYLNETDKTVVYEMDVEKVWYGDGFKTGKFIFEERSHVCMEDDVFELREGCRYVLPFYKGDKKIWNGDDYADGDITKESEYSIVYNFHPQIQVTNDNEYIVCEAFKTLTHTDNRTPIKMGKNWNYEDMYLINGDDFSTNMTKLIEKYLTD